MKHFLRCDCSMHKADWLYFIPTLKMFAHGKYLEVEIDFLLLCSLRNHSHHAGNYSLLLPPPLSHSPGQISGVLHSGLPRPA